MLLYAHRSESARHAAAAARVRELAEGAAAWALPVFVIGEFLRVATHPRVFNPPSSLEEASSAIDAVLASPSLRVLSPGDRYWPLLRETALEAESRGNLVFDAQIVAVCREYGVDTLLTEDRDFRRFPGIRVARLG